MLFTERPLLQYGLCYTCIRSNTDASECALCHEMACYRVMILSEQIEFLNSDPPHPAHANMVHQNLVWLSDRFILVYLHFQSKPLMNLKIIVTVYNSMKDMSMIDSCQAHLLVQHYSNI